jgi:hypothetical protein
MDYCPEHIHSLWANFSVPSGANVALCAFVFLTMSTLTAGPIHVLTSRYNDARTGANISETTLNVSNVNSATFGALFSLPVSGSVYAQPLYVPGVTIPGKGVHNVLYVCTMVDIVYAFDADSNTGSNKSPYKSASSGSAYLETNHGLRDWKRHRDGGHHEHSGDELSQGRHVRGGQDARKRQVRLSAALRQLCFWCRHKFGGD